MSKEKKEDIIILRAVYGKQQGACILTPLKDMSTGRLRGVDILSPDEERKAVKVVDSNTTRRVFDNLIINLNDPIDSVDWKWMKETREIAMTMKDAHSSPSALFYVYKPDQELDERLELKKAQRKASEVIDYPVDRKKELLEYLGVDASTLREKDVDDILYSRIEKKPYEILSAVQDPQFKTKIFLFRLVQNGTIRKDANGTYRYGDIILGFNEQTAIDYLNDVRNRNLVGKFYTEVYGKQMPKSQVSVVDELDSLEREDEDNAGGSGAGEAAPEESKTESEG